VKLARIRSEMDRTPHPIVPGRLHLIQVLEVWILVFGKSICSRQFSLMPRQAYNLKDAKDKRADQSAKIVPQPTASKFCLCCRLRLKCDGTRAETRFRLSTKRTRPFKSAGASVQSTTGSRGVRISCSNAGYTMFRGSVRVLATHYIRQFPLHFPSPCVTVCHHISTGLYRGNW
jgi:hypothetical protein